MRVSLFEWETLVENYSGYYTKNIVTFVFLTIRLDLKTALLINVKTHAGLSRLLQPYLKTNQWIVLNEQTVQRNRFALMTRTCLALIVQRALVILETRCGFCVAFGLYMVQTAHMLWKQTNIYSGVVNLVDHVIMSYSGRAAAVLNEWGVACASSFSPSPSLFFGCSGTSCTPH